jgi:long-chain acyl-CoA synthetase
VEEVLTDSCPAVKEAVVIGKPDPVLGQRVFAFVTLAPGSKTLVVADVLDKVSGRLAAYKVPEDLVVLDKLPRNALNKIDRAKLQIMLSSMV